VSEVSGSGERNWWESPFERRSIQRKMWVYTEDGQRLGRVSRMTGAALEVRPRPHGHVAYVVPVADIVGLTADAVRVRGPAAAYPLGEAPRTLPEPEEHTLPLADTLPH
jgi:hypothetical protein